MLANFSGVGERPARRRGAVPPPGSRRDDPRQLLLQLPLPYKAGAGRRRGRGCSRQASSSALNGAGPGGSAAQRERSSVPSLPWANQVSPPGQQDRGAVMARGSEVLSVTLSEAGWIPRGSGSTTSAGATRLWPRYGTTGCGMEGLTELAVSGAARKPRWPSGHRERGSESETEGGSSCLRARDCVREGFQALMGLALSPAKAWLLLCFRTGLELEKATEL